jgi:hypothetical protein
MPTNPARTITIALAFLLAVASLAGIGLGLYAVVDDLRVRTDDWDGLAAALGGLLAGYCAVTLVLCALAVALIARQSRWGYAWAVVAAVWSGGPWLLFGFGVPEVLLFALPSAALGVASLLAQTAERPQGVVEDQTGWGTR